MAAAGRTGGGVGKGQSGDMLGFRHPSSHAGVSLGDSPGSLLVGPLNVVLASLERRHSTRGRDLRPGGTSPDGMVDPERIPEVASQVLAEGQQF